VARDQGEFGVCATHELAHSNLSIPIANATTNYSDEDATVTITHENAVRLVIKLHPERSVRAFLVSEGRIPSTPQAFFKAFPLNLVVIPTLSPLEENEPYVTEETVRRNEITRLASRNFRNIWLRADSSSFDEFRSLVEDSWPGVSLRKPEVVVGPKSIVQMFYEEKRMQREVYWSGFGFQAWIQMIYHLVRGSIQSVLVLDEPDVYLHPDLQKRLYRLIEKRFGQSFVATHSTEILNEAHPGNVLLVKRGARSAQRVASQEGYRQVYSYLGSSENADFARIARAKRIVFFEGKDRRIVRRLAAKAGLSDGALDDPDTVYLQAGGYEQWRRVKEVGWTLHNVFDLSVKVAAIFDRDYRPQEEMESFAEGMCSPQLLCVVLSRKEIENYVLELPVLLRAIKGRMNSRGLSVTDNVIKEIIDGIRDRMRDETRTNIGNSFVSYRQRLDPDTDPIDAREDALSDFDAAWSVSTDQKLKIVSGKYFLSMLSASLQAQFGTSLTVNQIADEFGRHEIPAELIDILRRVETFIA
jgi:hypothetical protein